MTKNIKDTSNVLPMLDPKKIAKALGAEYVQRVSNPAEALSLYLNRSTSRRSPMDLPQLSIEDQKGLVVYGPAIDLSPPGISLEYRLAHLHFIAMRNIPDWGNVVGYALVDPKECQEYLQNIPDGNVATCARYFARPKS